MSEFKLSKEIIERSEFNVWDAAKLEWSLAHIYEWEYNFSIDTVRKIKLSAKQLQTRIKVNEKMLFNMRRANQNNT